MHRRASISYLDLDVPGENSIRYSLWSGAMTPDQTPEMYATIIGNPRNLESSTGGCFISFSRKNTDRVRWIPRRNSQAGYVTFYFLSKK